MSILIFIDKNISDYQTFITGVKVQIGSEFIKPFGQIDKNINRIGFVWENNGSKIPFGTGNYFNNKFPLLFFSNDFIEYLKLFSNKITVDLISCSFNSPLHLRELNILKKILPHVTFNYSINLTGNRPQGDWIMESSGDDISKIYFNMNILNYKNSLLNFGDPLPIVNCNYVDTENSVYLKKSDLSQFYNISSFGTPIEIDPSTDFELYDNFENPIFLYYDSIILVINSSNSFDYYISGVVYTEPIINIRYVNKKNFYIFEINFENGSKIQFKREKNLTKIESLYFLSLTTENPSIIFNIKQYLNDDTVVFYSFDGNNFFYNVNLYENILDSNIQLKITMSDSFIPDTNLVISGGDPIIKPLFGPKFALAPHIKYVNLLSDYTNKIFINAQVDMLKLEDFPQQIYYDTSFSKTNILSHIYSSSYYRKFHITYDKESIEIDIDTLQVTNLTTLIKLKIAKFNPKHGLPSISFGKFYPLFKSTKGLKIGFKNYLLTLIVDLNTDDRHHIELLDVKNMDLSNCSGALINKDQIIRISNLIGPELYQFESNPFKQNKIIITL